MTAATLLKACQNFAKQTALYLNIVDEQHYQETLIVLEKLLEKADDSPHDPLNMIIELLSRAVAHYENRDQELAEFEESIMRQPHDIALLRTLMDQHNLTMSELPEIGSKSMVSRVLSGQRQLTKKHILALAKRFKIKPDLFFKSENVFIKI